MSDTAIEDDYDEYYFEDVTVDITKINVHNYNLEQSKILEYLLMSHNNAGIAKLFNTLINEKIIKILDIEYEIEMIISCELEKDEKMYLVKWKNWDYEFSTWEPYENVADCKAILQEFENRPPDFIYPNNFREDKNVVIQKILDLVTKCDLTPELVRKYMNTKFSKKEDNVLIHQKHYKNSKKAVLAAYKEWERELNEIYPKLNIQVENKTDYEGPPPSFKYICDYVSQDVDLEPQCLVGCQCTEPCNSYKTCKQDHFMDKVPYTPTGKVNVLVGNAIYECNSACKCDINCRYRVVQRGVNHHLTIFRTRNRGWGLKTRKEIKKGTFIMEYLGEIVSTEVAENRGYYYDEQALTYLFDLDFNHSPAKYTIDAYKMGNLSHFINHSCEPNMDTYSVFIDNLNIDLPRIVFFANRNINKNEELTFDYKMCIPEDVQDNSKPMDVDETVQQTNQTIAPEPSESNGDSTIQDFPDNPESNGQYGTSASLTNSINTSEIGNNEDSQQYKKLDSIPCLCGAKTCRGALVSFIQGSNNNDMSNNDSQLDTK